MSSEVITIALCDDARAVKMFLRHILEEDGDLSVVSETSNGAEVVAGVSESTPDVLLLDLLLPDVPEPAELVARLRGASPRTRIMLISNLPVHRLEAEAERLQADGWVPKADQPQALRDAVRRVAAQT